MEELEEKVEEKEEEVEKVEDKGGREVTQARVQLHQMQPTGNHSTPFNLILGALQSIAQIVLYPETRKWRTSVPTIPHHSSCSLEYCRALHR